MDPDIALFAKVVEFGSMSAAARALSLSPAMVSKRITRLERRLGVRLLHRTTRMLQPTARGRRFYDDVVAIIATLEAAEQRVTDSGRVPAGALRITAPTSFGRMHLAPCLKPFLDRYPAVELTLDLSDAYSDLLRENFDLAVRITAPSASSGLVSRRLTGIRRVLCAAPAYLAANGAPEDIDSLQRHRLLAADGQMPWRLIGPGGQFSIDGASQVRTNSSEVVRELTLAGVGIALRSLWDVSAELACGRLVRVLPQVEGSGETGLFIVHRRTGVGPAAMALMDFLTDLWSPSAPWER